MTEVQDVAPETEATEEAVPSKEETSEATENTEGQDQDQPAESESEESQDDEEKSRSKERRERRKAQMERLRKEAEEADRKYRDSQERLRKAKEAAQGNTPPKEADFGDYNEYLVALGAYHADQRIGARSTQEIEEATKAEEARIKQLEQQQNEELAQSWADQVAEAKAKYSDFESVAYHAPISDDVARMVAMSDMGADVAYYLGTHREDAARISQLQPIEAARELGRIEATLSLPKPNTQSQAPDPVNPVRPRNVGTKSPDKMSFEEYKAARAAGKI